MPLEFTCPACEKALNAPFAAAGLAGKCKFCNARIIAPTASGHSATLADAAPEDIHRPEEPSSYEKPGAIPPDYPPSIAPDYGSIGTMPHQDVMSNPSVAHAFMSTGTPAVADFWKRAVGFALDMVIMGFMTTMLAVIMIGSGNIGSVSLLAATKSQVAGAFWFTFVIFAAKVLYGAVFEGSPLHATPGKWVLGMKVCSEQGAPLSFLQAVWRNFCKWGIISVVGFAPFIGWFPYVVFFYAMQDDMTQTWHDMLAGTVVAERSY